MIEATRWNTNGAHPADGDADGDAVRYGCQPGVPYNKMCGKCGGVMGNHGWIDALVEGVHIVCPGDWIITGARGERYPCKPDIFAATYDAALHPTPEEPSR